MESWGQGAGNSWSKGDEKEVLKNSGRHGTSRSPYMGPVQGDLESGANSCWASVSFSFPPTTAVSEPGVVLQKKNHSGAITLTRVWTRVFMTVLFQFIQDALTKLSQKRELTKNRDLFPTVLEAGSPRGRQTGCPHLAEGKRALSGVSLTRALISFTGAPHSCPNHLPEVPSPNAITLGIRFLHMTSWGYKHFPSISFSSSSFVMK